jgi:hypothetical protein
VRWSYPYTLFFNILTSPALPLPSTVGSRLSRLVSPGNWRLTNRIFRNDRPRFFLNRVLGIRSSWIFARFRINESRTQGFSSLLRDLSFFLSSSSDPIGLVDRSPSSGTTVPFLSPGFQTAPHTEITDHTGRKRTRSSRRTEERTFPPPTA